MNSLLEGFLKKAEDNAQVLTLQDMLTEEELFQYETLVKAYDSIDILNVGRDLKKICKTYQLSRWQELSLLAYVKTLEMMITRAKEANDGDILPPTQTPPQNDYSGSMFG